MVSNMNKKKVHDPSFEVVSRPQKIVSLHGRGQIKLRFDLG